MKRNEGKKKKKGEGPRASDPVLGRWSIEPEDRKLVPAARALPARRSDIAIIWSSGRDTRQPLRTQEVTWGVCSPFVVKTGGSAVPPSPPYVANFPATADKSRVS